MRCALAVPLLIAVLGAAPSRPAHAPHASRRTVPVRAVIVSGDAQRVRSYVAVAATAYDAGFTRPLVVTVDGPPVSPKHPRHVVFTCMTPGCTLAPTEQHEFDDPTKRAVDDDGKSIANAYDARVSGGRAGVYVTVRAVVPAGTYTVRALPVANAGERGVPVFFTLRAF